MANEITGLERTPDKGSGSNLGALFYYPIPPSLKVDGVVHSPSSGLPVGIADIMDPAEVAALDTGDALFHVDSIGVPEGETGAVTTTRLQTLYASIQSELVAMYTHRYELFGTRIDKA